MNFFTPLIDLLFPPICLGCKDNLHAGEKLLCMNCLFNLPKTNFHLINDNPAFEKLKRRMPIEHAVPLLYFTKEGLTQELMHQLKYKHQKALARLLGEILGIDLFKAELLNREALMIPVPLHPKKKKMRGYNQSEEIVRGLCKAISCPVPSFDLIEKVRDSDSQTHKNNLERLKNVENVFQLRRPELIFNRDLWLIDDVLTTGATLESFCLELLKGNPKSINIATLAIASD